MRTEEIKIYQYDELSDAAKEKARDWWRDCENEFGMETDYLYEDFERVAEILGIEFDQRAVPLMGGSTRKSPTIYWSGFWNQGDGACFEGYYSYAKNCAKRIREYAPTDETLHAIADSLQAIQRPAFYQLGARVDHTGRYYHANSMTIRVDHDGDRDATDAEEEDIREALRDFADWIYKRLEEEYEYRMSDEQIEESIRCNEYEFTADGARY